jgi:transcription factor CP2-like protein
LHQPPRLQIAKQFSPWGFHYTLEAATAQWVRKEEDRCTYLNKGQFYGVTLEYRPSPTENPVASLNEVKSVVVLVFRYVCFSQVLLLSEDGI